MILLIAAETDLLADQVSRLLEERRLSVKRFFTSRGEASSGLRLPADGLPAAAAKVWMRSRLSSWQTQPTRQSDYVYNEWVAWERGWLASMPREKLLNGPSPFHLPLSQNIALWPVLHDCGFRLPALMFSQCQADLEEFRSRWPIVVDVSAAPPCLMGLPSGPAVAFTLAGPTVVFDTGSPPPEAARVTAAAEKLGAALQRQFFRAQVVLSEQAIVLWTLDEDPHQQGFENLPAECQQQIAHGLAKWLGQ